MDVSLKDLLAPIATLVVLLFNGLYFNRRLELFRAGLADALEDKRAELAGRLEQKRGDVAVSVDSRKDIEKRRREALFRLRNLASIAARVADKVYVANRLNDKASAIEALLPNLTELWATTKSIKDESFNGDIDREDIKPYLQLHSLLVDYFFLLDNTKLGQQDYVTKLAGTFERIQAADAALTEHNRKRLEISL